MSILPQSLPGITLMIGYILFIWEKECGMLSRLFFLKVGQLKIIILQKIMTKKFRDTEGCNSETNELSHF